MYTQIQLFLLSDLFAFLVFVFIAALVGWFGFWVIRDIVCDGCIKDLEKSRAEQKKWFDDYWDKVEKEEEAKRIEEFRRKLLS